MKLRKLALFAAAAAMVLGMSVTAYAARYQDWYYQQYGAYPSDDPDDWYDDPAYWVYLDSVTGGSDSYYYDDSDYYYYDYYDYGTTYYATITDAYWNGSTAKWSIDGKASKYQVRVYRDGTRLGTNNTKNKSYSLSSYITKEGYYYFEVRAYNKYSGWSDWYESDDKYYSPQAASTAASGSGTSAVMMIGPGATQVSQSQWLQASDGTGRWWYRHADGGYTSNGWELINSKWYYFDEAGWMKTGWLTIGGSTYYLGNDGAMVTGMSFIDGANHNFDPNGQMLY